MRRTLRPLLVVAALVALVVTAVACSDSNATSTTSAVTSPSSTTITESFTGTLTLNGAASFPFSSTTSGSMTATLTTFSPDTTLPVGLWFGVWDGSRCFNGGANDKAVQGSVLPAFAPSAGTWCVRIYDSMGNVPASPGGDTYQLDVTHP
jgi:hypothetical protein